MSTLSSAREIARTEASPFTFGRAVALLAGAVVVGIEASMSRAELPDRDASWPSSTSACCATSGWTAALRASRPPRASGPN